MHKFFLIGMMGAGKTMHSRRWGKIINAPAYDLDDQIETEEGMPVSDIFSIKGEAYFRSRESQVLKSFKNRDEFILATGGGTPCQGDNMEWMNAHGITIWLNVPVEILASRLKYGKAKRPLISNLNDGEIADFIHHKLIERAPYYSKAHHIIDGDEITLNTFKEIIKHYDK